MKGKVLCHSWIRPVPTLIETPVVQPAVAVGSPPSKLKIENPAAATEWVSRALRFSGCGSARENRDSWQGAHATPLLVSRSIGVGARTRSIVGVLGVHSLRVCALTWTVLTSDGLSAIACAQSAANRQSSGSGECTALMWTTDAQMFDEGHSRQFSCRICLHWCERAVVVMGERTIGRRRMHRRFF